MSNRLFRPASLVTIILHKGVLSGSDYIGEAFLLCCKNHDSCRGHTLPMFMRNSSFTCVKTSYSGNQLTIKCAPSPLFSSALAQWRKNFLLLKD